MMNPAFMKKTRTVAIHIQTISRLVWTSSDVIILSAETSLIKINEKIRKFKNIFIMKI